jgi:SAM-dependent methyltransferase
VHLVDVVPLHVKQAQMASAASRRALASAEVADARRLPFASASADAVLMHGPLYHLTKRDERLRAIREAGRVLKPGGVLLAVAISAHFSTHAGLARGWVADGDYLRMCRKELATGQHVRPASWPRGFARAFCHRPEELKAEIEEGGFTHQATLAIQGGGWLLPDFEERWKVAAQRKALLALLRLMEQDSVAIGLSAHFLSVGRKPTSAGGDSRLPRTACRRRDRQCKR